ncbi:MAG: hypothetical protein WCT22_00350 [Patescibacteria group bacterium]
MRRFVVDLFVLFFVSLVIGSVLNYSYQKKLALLTIEKNNCQKQLVEKKPPVLTLSDASFVSKRDKELESVKKSPLYFSAKTNKLSASQWIVTIELSGLPDSAADASDLKIIIPENLVASDLKVGNAFPIFPRQVIDGSYLLVTGLASTNNNEMLYGKPNKIFAEFTVTVANNNQTDKRQITVDTTDTKIYLNGESVLNTDKSVKLINLL